MNQLHGVRSNNNNNSSRFGYYGNRGNVIPDYSNVQTNRPPVSFNNGNNVYAEREQSNIISNKIPVYRGNESLYVGTPSKQPRKQSIYAFPTRSSGSTSVQHHERTNTYLEEVKRNRVPKLMPMQTSKAEHTSTNINNLSKPQKTEEASSEIKPFGSSVGEKLCIFTGTVEKLIEWNKMLANNFCYYEVIATVVFLKEGTIRTQKIMLLKNTTGPVLQVVYYTVTHIDLDDFYLGKTIRCVGYMSGSNVLNAFSIRGATQEEIDNLQRFNLISDQAVSLKLKKTNVFYGTK